MEIVPGNNFQLFPFEEAERILKERLKEGDNGLICKEIDNLIESVIKSLVREGKTDKQIYAQLKFLGRKLNFGRVEYLRFRLKQEKNFQYRIKDINTKETGTIDINIQDSVTQLKPMESMIFCEYFLRSFRKCHWSFELSPVCQACAASHGP